MAVPPAYPPPGGPWYRRRWAYANRPYGGCGCLYTIVLVLLVWFVLSLFIDLLRVY